MLPANYFEQYTLPAEVIYNAKDKTEQSYDDDVTGY